MSIYCSKGHENPDHNNFCKYCGEKLLKPTIALSPELILGERYRIIKQISPNPSGRIYLAEDLHRFEEKCILKDLGVDTRILGDRENSVNAAISEQEILAKYVQLFSQETGKLYKLYHPQIPSYREIFSTIQPDGKEHLFLVQDYVEGESYRYFLQKRIEQNLKFSEGEVKQFLSQIMPVIQYIHNMGVIHRNICPDNLIYGENNKLPILINFGGIKQIIAMFRVEIQQDLPSNVGAMGYAPPEQIQTDMVDFSSDLYALGATVLTGKEPRDLINSQTQLWNWREEVKVSENFGEILDKMVAILPGDRFQSAQEVMDVLGTISSQVAMIKTTPVSLKKSAFGDVFQTISKWGVIVLIFVITVLFFGWVGFQFMIVKLQNNSQNPDVTTSVASKTADSQSGNNSNELLRQRRQKLNIREQFLTEITDYIFTLKYPNVEGKKPSNSEEEKKLKAEYSQIMADVLDNIEQANLSLEVRQKLGRYKLSEQKLWIAEMNKLRLSSRTLQDLTEFKFSALPKDFSPKSLGVNFEIFLTKPVGQVWLGIMADQVNNIKGSKDFEQVSFNQGETNKEIQGNLLAGEGKAIIIKLSAGQDLAAKLDTNGGGLLSIHSPTGKVKILEDSAEKIWAGKLPETGFYEFVIVGDRSKPSDYKLIINLK
jgi:serine/threonine protein kinase, bacterial